MSGFKRRSTAADHSAMAKVAERIGVIPPSDEGAVALLEQPASQEGVTPPSNPRPVPIGSIVEIAVAELRENPQNARTILSPASVDEMAGLLQKAGQDTPVPIFYDEGGRPTLYDGHRRRAAAIALGWKTIRAEVRPPPESELAKYLVSRRYNKDREGQSALDDALAWRRLLNQHHIGSQDALAETLGISKATISKTLSLAELPRSVMGPLCEQPDLLSFRILYEIYLFWKDAGDEETLQVIADAIKRGLGSKDIEAYRLARGRGPRRKPRSAKRLFHVGKVRGEMRRFDAEGRLELHIKGLGADALEGLEAEIARVVSAEPELPIA